MGRRRRPLPVRRVHAPRRHGAGARPPTSRSCATSCSTARATRATPSSATTGTCAPTTGTPSRRRRGRSRRLGGGPAALRRRAVQAGGERFVQLGAAIRGHEPAQDEAAGGDHGLARQPRVGPDRLHRDRRSREDEPLHRHQRAGRRAAVGPPEPRLRLRHAPGQEAHPNRSSSPSSRRGTTRGSTWPGRASGCRSSRSGSGPGPREAPTWPCTRPVSANHSPSCATLPSTHGVSATGWNRPSTLPCTHALSGRPTRSLRSWPSTHPASFWQGARGGSCSDPRPGTGRRVANSRFAPTSRVQGLRAAARVTGAAAAGRMA